MFEHAVTRTEAHRRAFERAHEARAEAVRGFFARLVGRRR